MRFSVLDSFRGLAAVFVLIFHMRLIDTFTEWTFFRNAYYFVEFFFVLSGFVIAYSYLKKGKHMNIKEFMLRRSFRIVPLHLFVLSGFLAYELLKLAAALKGHSFETVFFMEESAIQTLFYNLVLLQKWVGVYSINGPSWSISIEFYLYFIFAVILVFSTNAKTAMLLILCATIYFLVDRNVNDELLKLVRGISCFFAGVFVYILYDKFFKVLSTVSRQSFVVAELVCLVMVVGLITSDADYKNLLALLVFSFTIFVFAFEKGVMSTFFKLQLFTRLGELSYSIYLVHFLIINFYSAVILLNPNWKNYTYIAADNWRIVDFQNVAFNILFLVLVVVTSIAVSCFTYKYIEMPFNQFGKKLSGRLACQ